MNTIFGFIKMPKDNGYGLIRSTEVPVMLRSSP